MPEGTVKEEEEQEEVEEGEEEEVHHWCHETTHSLLPRSPAHRHTRTVIDITSGSEE